MCEGSLLELLASDRADPAHQPSPGAARLVSPIRVVLVVVFGPQLFVLDVDTITIRKPVDWLCRCADGDTSTMIVASDLSDHGMSSVVVRQVHGDCPVDVYDNRSICSKTVAHARVHWALGVASVGI